MADFDIQIVHRVEEIGPDAWDRLSGGRPLASYRWYRFGEAVLADCPPTYIVLSHSGKPVARATFWLKRREWLPVTSRLLQLGAEQLLRQWPLLACETPLTCLSGLILPAAPLRAAALETIAQTALEAGRKQHAPFTLFGYIGRQEAQQERWPKAFSAVTYSDAETSLSLIWPDFESYLKHLAKSTRRNYRLHTQRAADLGVVIKTYPAPPDVDQALKLIQNVETYHRVGHRPWARAMLDKTSQVDSLWIAAQINDRLVGCCSLIGDSGVLTATLLGLDYTFPEFDYVYYQVIYAAVRCAIERQATVLQGGGGAYELKRRLGFQTMPEDYVVTAASGQLFQWLVRGVIRWGGPQKVAPETTEEPGVEE